MATSPGLREVDLSLGRVKYSRNDRMGSLVSDWRGNKERGRRKRRKNGVEAVLLACEP